MSDLNRPASSVRREVVVVLVLTAALAAACGRATPQPSPPPERPSATVPASSTPVEPTPSPTVAVTPKPTFAPTATQDPFQSIDADNLGSLLPVAQREVGNLLSVGWTEDGAVFGVQTSDEIQSYSATTGQATSPVGPWSSWQEIGPVTAIKAKGTCGYVALTHPKYGEVRIGDGEAFHTIRELWSVPACYIAPDASCNTVIQLDSPWPDPVCRQVNAVAVSPYGSSVVGVAGDNLVHQFDVDAGSLLYGTSSAAPAWTGTWEGKSRIESLMFSADGKHVAGFSGKDVGIWVRTIKLHSLAGPPFRVSGFAVTEGREILLWNDGGSIALYDLPSGQYAVSNVSTKVANIRWAAIGPSGQVALVNRAQEIVLFDTTQARNVLRIPPLTRGVVSVEVSPDRRDLVAGLRDGRIVLVQVGPSQITGKGTWLGHTDAVRDLQYDATGAFAASGSLDGRAIVWETASGTAAQTLEAHAGGVFAVAFGPDGDRLATAGADGAVRLWDWRSGEMVRLLEAHSGPVRDLAFDPGGSLLASAGLDGRLVVWEVATGSVRASEDWSTHSLTALAFSPSSTTIAAGTTKGAVLRWDYQRGTLLETLSLHEQWINRVAFSSQGDLIFTASDDNTVRAWAIVDRRATLLTTHDAWALGLAISRDGKLLATGADDGTMRLLGVLGVLDP